MWGQWCGATNAQQAQDRRAGLAQANAMTCALGSTPASHSVAVHELISVTPGAAPEGCTSLTPTITKWTLWL